MTKIPLEKCLARIPNIFNLILVASRRARQLSYGQNPKISYDNKEKPALLALREIAEGAIGTDILAEEVPVYNETNLGFANPGPLPPLSAIVRVNPTRDETDESDLRNLNDSELGLSTGLSARED